MFAKNIYLFTLKTLNQNIAQNINMEFNHSVLITFRNP